MTPAAQHPQRCETCESFKKGTDHGESDMGDCRSSKRRITWQQWCIIRDVGCASHPSAQQQHVDAGWIRAVVELDEMSFDNCVMLSGIEEGTRKEDFIKIRGLASIGTKVEVLIRKWK